MSHKASGQEKKHNILFVCTSSRYSSWGSVTGLWLDELVIPYYIFIEAGYSVDIASIHGGEPPIDPACGESPIDPTTKSKFISDSVARDKFSSTRALRDIVDDGSISKYGCIFLCGGHGCFGDFRNNLELTNAIEYVYAINVGCVASICHGSIALLNCKYNGKNILSDKFVAVFTNEEEEELGLVRRLPFLLQNAIDEAGAIFMPSPPW